jgi:hypothetical protein
LFDDLCGMLREAAATSAADHSRCTTHAGEVGSATGLLAAGLFVRKPAALDWLWSLCIVIDLILTAITAVPAALEWAKLGRPRRIPAT